MAVLTLLAALATIGGGLLQNVALNFWVQNFINNATGGVFTVLISSSIFYVVVFLVSFLGALVFAKQRIVLRRFSLHAAAVIGGIGFFDAANGVFVVFAVAHVPQLLQVIFACLITVFTVLLTPLCMLGVPKPQPAGKEEKTISLTTGLSMLLLTAACVVVALPDFSQGTRTDGNPPESASDRMWWSLIYSGAMIPGALYNILQGRFIRISDCDPRPTAGAAHAASMAEVLLAKFFVLLAGCAVQLVAMFLFFPLDWAPWFGEFPDRRSAESGLSSGFACIAHCQGNFTYFVLFNLGYSVSYVGGLALNVLSPNFSSLVGQLVAPVSGILLILFPSLNVQYESVQLPFVLASLSMILGSTLVYFVGFRQSILGTAAPRKEQPTLLVNSVSQQEVTEASMLLLSSSA